MTTSESAAAWSSTTVRHGTPSGWTLHQRLEERPCDPCYQAKQEYDQRWKAAPRNKRMNRLNAKAQARANVRLRHAHDAEYRQYYAEEKAKIMEDERVAIDDA